MHLRYLRLSFFILFGSAFLLIYFDNNRTCAIFKVNLKLSTLFNFASSNSAKAFLTFSETVAEEGSLKMQKQRFRYNQRVRMFNVLAAICDQRLSGSKQRNAIHVFAVMGRVFEDNGETKEWLRETWKCRLYYQNSSKIETFPKLVNVPLSSVIWGFQATFILLSCFMQSDTHGCPSHVSIIPGNVYYLQRICLTLSIKLTFIVG